jgi:hypothetical protein
VRIRLPRGRRVAAIHLLVAKQNIPYKQIDGALELETPSIGLHEVVAIDFAA